MTRLSGSPLNGWTGHGLLRTMRGGGWKPRFQAGAEVAVLRSEGDLAGVVVAACGCSLSGSLGGSAYSEYVFLRMRRGVGL